ncbi:PspC domain-containing protein [Luteithermobacter gelatinilyticus]|uniref:PspC domain-containing protein n=1 Tax=Luteithermobacter gelatinilyticus TaxID=2582913 RepID=UPI001105B7EB|nr:PspC domain-containing protein [Luteithermobacter gelatinilyticus]|tara:strand:+ start:6220 stop:6474 length:255 start_codon:yes stop_codon:yes gene_type:complete
MTYRYNRYDTYEDSFPPGGRRLYKNSLKGKICGVFAGLGDYLGINAALLRILGLIALLFVGPVVILGYLVMALVLTDQPHRFYR